MIVLALLALQQAPVEARSPAGAYWQQDVAYEITARLDEPSGTLGGAERIAYHNQSPDTLTSFALHLYLNAFRPGSRWADADSMEGKRRFNDLHDPDFAFNHVRDVRIMGQSVQPETAAMLFHEGKGHIKTDIMTGIGVLISYITQSCN